MLTDKRQTLFELELWLMSCNAVEEQNSFLISIHLNSREWEQCRGNSQDKQFSDLIFTYFKLPRILGESLQNLMNYSALPSVRLWSTLSILPNLSFLFYFETPTPFSTLLPFHLEIPRIAMSHILPLLGKQSFFLQNPKLQ